MNYNEMFKNATAFNQALTNWNIGSNSGLDGMFSGSGLSRANYDLTLADWSLDGATNVLMTNQTGMEYCSSVAERNTLISNGWTITGDSECSEGCMDPAACNYRATALEPGDITCIYAIGCDTCSGSVDGTGTVIDNDSDNDGVCDDDEVLGCTDVSALNYDPLASDDDGSCYYDVYGCFDGNACNFDPQATADDGSCTYPTDLTVSSNESIICAGEGTTISVASSEIGTMYTLRNDADNSIVAGPFEGTGGNLEFLTGAIPISTTYHVLAENSGVQPSALDFDTSGQHAELPAGISEQFGSNVTVEGWYNITSSQNQVFLVGETFGGSIKFCVYYNSNGIKAGNYSGGWHETAEIPLPTGWTHIAATYDGSMFKLFYNGVEVASQSYSGGLPAAQGGWVIGEHWNPGKYMDSDVNEVRIWDYAKTETEIASGMNTCATGSESGLVACYSFDDPVGSTTLTDSSPNAFHGTLVGFDATDWTSDNVCSAASLCSVELSQMITITVSSAVGCLDPTACNYNSSALCPGASCVYAAGCDICSGENDGSGSVIDNDADDDGVCDNDEVLGCTDIGAYNYNAAASEEDGTCIYAGCLYPFACNYDPLATLDDSSCEMTSCVTCAGCSGCAYEGATNYDASVAFDDGSCIFEIANDCPNDINGDGQVGTSDLLELLAQFGVNCP